MFEWHLATGGDWDVLIWLIIMGLWGLGRLFAAKKKPERGAGEEPEAGDAQPASGPRSPTSQKQPGMRELIEAMRGELAPASPTRSVPPPSAPEKRSSSPRVQPSPVAPRQRTVSARPLRVASPQAAVKASASGAAPRCTSRWKTFGGARHLPSALQDGNALSAGASVLKLPGAPLELDPPTRQSNPVRPDWRRPGELKKAIVASAILGPRPYA